MSSAAASCLSSGFRSFGHVIISYLEFTALPEEIRQRIDLDNGEHQRIDKGLLYRRNIRLIPSEGLTKNALNRLAQETNATFIHASGNCVLLSLSLLRNLIRENNALCVQNTFPIYRGISSVDAATIVFGEELTYVSAGMSNLDEVEDTILRNYYEHNERFYVLSSQGYRVPLLGECGHNLNAVVLIREDGQPYVQFVDAWKTSDTTPTKETLSRRYQEATFSLYTSK